MAKTRTKPLARGPKGRQEAYGKERGIPSTARRSSRR